jgi:AraC-like DNA-binding protein
MEITHLNTLRDYNERFGFKGGNHLVNVVDFRTAEKCENGSFTIGFYIVKLKLKRCGDILYGKTEYDYTEDSMFCFAPGQLVRINLKKDEKPNSVCLLFHPDLLHGTELGKNIRTKYPYFFYDTHKALQVSEEEKHFLLKVMECIQREADAEQDAHSMNMVRIYLELILEFLLRLYDQQFERQSPQNQEMLSRFENLLHDYFAQRLSKKMGLPRVEYFAGQFGYTPKYFSDLIKKSIGIGAQDYILSYTTNLAKHMMLLPGASVKETAYELGFQYPQHFTRFFRNHVGCSPKEFKKLMGEPTSPESPLLTDAEGLHR